MIPQRPRHGQDPQDSSLEDKPSAFFDPSNFFWIVSSVISCHSISLSPVTKNDSSIARVRRINCPGVIIVFVIVRSIRCYSSIIVDAVSSGDKTHRNRRSRIRQSHRLGMNVSHQKRSFQSCWNDVVCVAIVVVVVVVIMTAARVAVFTVAGIVFVELHFVRNVIQQAILEEFDNVSASVSVAYRQKRHVFVGGIPGSGRGVNATIFEGRPPRRIHFLASRD
jgi:hypothetical protein